jgi:hypothetical protein
MALLPAILLLITTGCVGFHNGAKQDLNPYRTGSVMVRRAPFSWIEIRNENTVRQSLDYSCGAASMATLLRFYFGDDASEVEILIDALASLNSDELMDRTAMGLSMLDLKNYALRRGYQAVGVRLAPEALPQLKGPVIARINRHGIDHFVVIRTVVGDRVYLSDPSWGNVREPIWEFCAEWDGHALILGKPGFGLPEQHPLQPRKEEELPDMTLPARRSFTHPL